MKLVTVRESNGKQSANEEMLQIELHEGGSPNTHSLLALIRRNRAHGFRQLELDLTLNRGDVSPAARADHAIHVDSMLPQTGGARWLANSQTKP